MRLLKETLLKIRAKESMLFTKTTMAIIIIVNMTAMVMSIAFIILALRNIMLNIMEHEIENK